MAKIKLVATDLDGTVLNSRRQISPETKEVLKQLIDQGVLVVPLSGRPKNSIQQAFPGIKLEYLIGYNGGLIQKSDGTIIYQSTLSKEQLDLLLKMRTFSIRGPYLLGANHFYVKSRVNRMQETFCKTMWQMGARTLTKEDYGKIIKCEFHSSHIFRSRFYKRWQKELEANFDVTTSGGWTLELTKHGVTKGKSLEILRNELGLKPEEIVVFGDNLNDLSAFQLPGITKVAMGNAIDQLKDLADFVTADNDHNGVGEFLKQYL